MCPQSTLVAFVLALLFSACQPREASPTAAPPASQIINTQARSPEPERIAGTIEVNSPSNMTFADGLLWVIAGSSIVRIDPTTNEIVGKPVSPGVRAEDIAVSNGTLWITRVGPGDLGAPSNSDTVLAIDPESAEILATINVPRAPVSLAVVAIL